MRPQDSTVAIVTGSSRRIDHAIADYAADVANIIAISPIEPMTSANTEVERLK